MLLISPGIIKPTDVDFGLPHLVSIGGVLQRDQRVRVEIVDLSYEGGDYRHLEKTLAELGPFLLIGISCYSSFDYLRVVTLARFIKELYPAVPLVSGGYHASALPADLAGEGGPFAAVVQGEGELPLGRMVETLLGGGSLEPRVHGPEVVKDLDSLPPYRWELLHRYWPRAQAIGAKLQIYLSRGCPFHCTFCMERAKQAYRWRAYSPERAVDELARLDATTPLGPWVVNLADPLFGFKRAWRRQVLEQIVRRELLPRHYWTLTRANELEEEDLKLLSRARVSVGVGLESGSPRMLELMRKTPRPGRYLESLERFAALANRHAVNWSANLVVGHPGETLESMQDTLRFARRLYTSEPNTRGWLSVDPFRLYPGSQVHAEMGRYAREHGARFHHPRWWESWYDSAFLAEHLDPSAALSYETRVRFTHDNYAPLVREIARRFRGQGKSIDSVFTRSVNEQVAQLGQDARDRLLSRAGHAPRSAAASTTTSHPGPDSASATASHPGPGAGPTALPLPIGLQVRDPWVRRREDAVRRLVGRGVVCSEPVVEALLLVPPQEHMEPAEAEAMLADTAPTNDRGAVSPPWLPLTLYGLALEALDLSPGDRVADMLATRGYLAALLSRIVTERGAVVAACPGPSRAVKALRRQLSDLRQVQVVQGAATTARGLEGAFHGLVIPGALPTLPRELVRRLDAGGRVVALVGPRFRRQDMVSVRRGSGGLEERVLTRFRAPPAIGPHGWLIY